MSGYIKETEIILNMDPEWDDKIVERIIEFCVADFDLNTENFNVIQFDNAKKISKNLT